MRSYPNDEWDKDEAARLGAPQWMLDLLKLNPDYTCWGPHEDYMWKKGREEGGEGGWDARVINATWACGANAPGLDDLNEVVNFYFSVTRESAPCEECGQEGYNPATKLISDTFYRHSSPTGEYWSDKLTQEEVDHLFAEGRLGGFQKKEGAKPPLAADVNAANSFEQGRKYNFGLSHDAINRGILIKFRAEKAGVYGLCPKCEGHGHYYTEPEPRVTLTLWVLHPRKGCSRGWEITRIEQNELPEVFAYLAEAAKRNADRFKAVVKAAKESK